MDYERIRTFINSYNNDDTGLLGEIHSEALASYVPIIRDETREFLRTVIMMQKPARILELGTAVGYSSIVMAEMMKIYGVVDIISVEIDAKTADIARNNIEKAGHSDGIKVITGDAEAVLKDIKAYMKNVPRTGETKPDEMNIVESNQPLFDMVFIDAAKAQYKNYLEMVIPYIHSGSIILCDNILMGGEVLESHFHVEKRDRTIHDKMRSFLYELKNDHRFITSIIAVGDGMTLSYMV